MIHNTAEGNKRTDSPPTSAYRDCALPLLVSYQYVSYRTKYFINSRSYILKIDITYSFYK